MLVALLASCSGRPDSRPNILVVLWDTVRADRLGLYGFAKPTTPFLDEWAKDARVFLGLRLSSQLHGRFARLALHGSLSHRARRAERTNPARLVPQDPRGVAGRGGLSDLLVLGEPAHLRRDGFRPGVPGKEASLESRSPFGGLSDRPAQDCSERSKQRIAREDSSG
ncbi:MAG: sulfatase-like hydrolase/transferase [Candidatus Eisenbacteria bacterium]|nr:sulfatase-like hydrolase/transferase [Candidatus Eisenbacteria bacterium]